MMKNKFLFFPALIIILVAVSACGPTVVTSTIPVPGGAEATDVPTQPPTTAPIIPSIISECDNPLYPVVVGATWTYVISGPPDSTQDRTIQEVRSDGFTDHDEFSGGTSRTGEWTCSNGDLIALNPAASGATTASMITAGTMADFQTTSSDGMTLPAVVTEGTNWTQNMTLEGIQTFNNIEVASKLTFSNNCTGGGIESVTVAAGTFNARRVDCIGSFNITITMNGMEIPTASTATTTLWYAEGVGMVKNSSILSDGTTSTVELTAYNIP
jgi:hypothetical protein